MAGIAATKQWTSDMPERTCWLHPLSFGHLTNMDMSAISVYPK
jgi:hypothetical protein